MRASIRKAWLSRHTTPVKITESSKENPDFKKSNNQNSIIMKKKYNRISNVDEPTTSSTDVNNSNINTNNNQPSNANSANITPSSSTLSTSSATPNNKSLGEKLSEKVHALILIALSYCTIQYTQTVPIILTSTDIVRSLLYVSIVFLCINTILLLYLSIYIPKIKGINVDNINAQSYRKLLSENNHNVEITNRMFAPVSNSDLWNVYCPRVIPIMTLNGVLCGIFLMRCFWPVWGFLTPLILGIEFFGMLFVTQFIPWC